MGLGGIEGVGEAMVLGVTGSNVLIQVKVAKAATVQMGLATGFATGTALLLKIDRFVVFPEDPGVPRDTAVPTPMISPVIGSVNTSMQGPGMQLEVEARAWAKSADPNSEKATAKNPVPATIRALASLVNLVIAGSRGQLAGHDQPHTAEVFQDEISSVRMLS